MEKIEFIAEEREGTGKKFTRKLRREGYIPAILYGPDSTPVLLKLKKKGTESIIKHLESHNVMADLVIEKNGKKEKITVVLKEIQTDPIKDDIIHLDFYRVRMDKPITITVPLHFTGESPGIEKGGILEEEIREITIECLPRDIPDFIEVDISSLDLGDVVFVKDLKVPENIKILEDPEKVIASILAPKAVEVEETETVEETPEEPEVLSETKAEERRKEKEEEK